MESKLGRIAPGYDADFTILERNPLTCPTRAIPEIGVLATIVRGEVVYSNGFRF
jgi:predicted amidohydrolase YtcJ